MTTQKQYTNDTSPKAVEMGKTAAIKKAINLSEFDVFILCKPADMFSPQTYVYYQNLKRLQKKQRVEP